jgi:hypothetical protein
MVRLLKPMVQCSRMPQGKGSAFIFLLCLFRVLSRYPAFERLASEREAESSTSSHYQHTDRVSVASMGAVLAGKPCAWTEGVLAAFQIHPRCPSMAALGDGWREPTMLSRLFFWC